MSEVESPIDTQPAPGAPTGEAAPSELASDPVAGAEPGVDAAAPVEFGELEPGAPGADKASLTMLYDLMMPVSVELGRTAMSVRDVLELGRGAVIPLNRMAGEPIDVYVSDRKLAEGEVVVLGEHFGVRLTRVIANAAKGVAAG